MLIGLNVSLELLVEVISCLTVPSTPTTDKRADRCMENFDSETDPFLSYFSSSERNR
jgi:hypothetical protein